MAGLAIRRRQEREGAVSCPRVWWIDDRGRWNPVGEAADSQATGEYNAVLETPVGRDMMYRHFGMLRLEETANRVSVSWDIRHVCESALNEACDYLQQVRQPVQLRFCFVGWHEEVHSKGGSALDRMRWTRAYSGVTPLPRPSIWQRSLSEALNSHNGFGLLLKGLEENDGCLTPELRAEFERRGLMDKLVLFSEEGEKANLVFSHIGEHSALRQVFGEAWAAEAKGRRYDFAPCADGPMKRIWDPYEPTLESAQPRFDHVRTLLCQPQDEGRWITYKRLLVPHRLPGQRRGLALLSRLTRAVAIPFMDPGQAM